MNRRKLFGTILGIIIWCCCIVFFTYAWYTWRSSNNLVNLNISDPVEVEGTKVVIENEGNITANNIGPVLDVNDGVKSGFVVGNGTVNDIDIYIDLKINYIDDELLNDSFKYMIVKSEELPTGEDYDEGLLEYDYDNPLLTGDFSDFSINTFNIGEDSVTSEKVVFYKVIFYIDGNVENDINMMNKSIDVDLIVNDEPVTLFANFVGADDYLDVNYKVVVAGEGYGELPVPVREHYSFLGWYLEDTYETQVTASSLVEASDDITLYAKWDADQYTINYYLQTTKIGSTTCTYDASCTLKTFAGDLEQTFPYSGSPDYGWRFEGWATTQTSTDRAYTDGYTFTSFDLESNINLYAVGRRYLNFYSGISPSNGSIASPVQYWNTYSTSNTNLTAVNVPTATAISGWTFIGYKGGDSSATSSVDISSSGSQVVPYNIYPTIRSKYQRTITLAYNANGGSGTTASSSTTQYYNSGYGSGGTNSGAKVSTHSFTLSSNGFTRSGYTFSKWADGSASGTQYAVGSSISFSPAVGSTATKTMYAVWTANLQSVTLASGPTKTTYYSDEDVSYTGITLKRTYTDGSTNTIDGTSYVTGYTTNTDNASGVRYTITVKYGSFDAISITTYKAGWYGVVNGDWYYYTGNGEKITGDVNLPVKNYSSVTRAFHFYSDGKMHTGWLQKSTSYYYYIEYPDNTIGKTDYMSWDDIMKKEDQDAGVVRGAILKSYWIQVYDSSRSTYFWYHLNSDGVMQTGWFQDVDGKWYYLRPDYNWCTSGPLGSMVASATCPIGNTNYTFNSSGVCTSSGC